MSPIRSGGWRSSRRCAPRTTRSHTAIDARRQEINAANWMLSTEDKSTRGNEILEFVEDNIYPLLDNAALARRRRDPVRLRRRRAGVRLGRRPLRPWRRSSREDPPRARSHAAGASTSQARAHPAAERLHVPISRRVTSSGSSSGCTTAPRSDASRSRQKLLIWTYDKQGDDHWGVPPTRHCYKAWTFKQQIEKLNLLHTDRFGVGLPVMEEGEAGARPSARARGGVPRAGARVAATT
jgi:hypothetical protein